MESYLNSQEYQQINNTIGQNHTIYNIALLEQSTSHALLHKSHRILAPKLSKVLGEMKAVGLFQQYRDQIGEPLKTLEW